MSKSVHCYGLSAGKDRFFPMYYFPETETYTIVLAMVEQNDLDALPETGTPCLTFQYGEEIVPRHTIARRFGGNITIQNYPKNAMFPKLANELAFCVFAVKAMHPNRVQLSMQIGPMGEA